MLNAFRLSFPAIGALAIVTALAACDGSTPNQAKMDCEQASYIVLEGARCLLKESNIKAISAPLGQSASDPKYCDRRIDDFREWGLGRYDAEEILRSSLDIYFKKYKDRGFCEELKVKQAFGFSMR